jgi:peroxiredoxin
MKTRLLTDMEKVNLYKPFPVFLAGFVLFFTINIFPQKAVFYIPDIENSKCVLSFLRGETVYKIDTLAAEKQGKYFFIFAPQKNRRGFYRITYGKNKHIDFIYDNDEIDITAGSPDSNEGITVNKPGSNEIYRRFLKLNVDFKTKSDLLLFLLKMYPKDDDFYSAVKAKLSSLQKEYSEFIESVSETRPGDFIEQYVRSARLSAADVNMPVENRLLYLKTHGLDSVDFSNSDLIFSDVFTNKVIEYLTLYRNPQLTKAELEKEFTAAVDSVLRRANKNAIVYRQVTEYLVDGFRKFGFDYIIDYIVDNYVIKDEICLDEKLSTSIQRRMDQAGFLKIGSSAPAFSLPDSSGNRIEPGQIKASKILLIFYASRCPHCAELLPKISEFYNNSKERNFEVIAVSIDTSRTDWIKFIKANNFNWVNLCDFKGWNSPAAIDYFLYATPSFFILDVDRKIIAKPYALDEIKNDLLHNK